MAIIPGQSTELNVLQSVFVAKSSNLIDAHPMYHFYSILE